MYQNDLGLNTHKSIFLVSKDLKSSLTVGLEVFICPEFIALYRQYRQLEAFTKIVQSIRTKADF